MSFITKRACACAAIFATASAMAADQPAAPAAAGQELPSYEVPIKPDAAEAYWAPDSRHLIAQTKDPQAIKGPSGGDGSLTYIFTDDGKEIWRVNDHGQDACSFFFADGKRIVWTSTRDHMDYPVGNWSDSTNYPQGGELYISDWKGKNIKRLTNNKYYEAEVSVSPDGQWVTFGRQIEGRMDIWVIHPDGTGEFQVTKTDDWQEGAPFFMQDNQHIIFRAWRASEYKKIRPTPMTVFTIKRDGTDWRRHTYDRGMNWHPTPAPDGHHYVYVRAETLDQLGDLSRRSHRDRSAAATDILRQARHPRAHLPGRKEDELGSRDGPGLHGQYAHVRHGRLFARSRAGSFRALESELGPADGGRPAEGRERSPVTSCV